MFQGVSVAFQRTQRLSGELQQISTLERLQSISKGILGGFEALEYVTHAFRRISMSFKAFQRVSEGFQGVLGNFTDFWMS